MWMLMGTGVLLGCNTLFVKPTPTPVSAIPSTLHVAPVSLTFTSPAMFTSAPTIAATPTFTPEPTFTPTPAFTDSLTPTATWIHIGPYALTMPILLYHRIDVSPINSQYYVTPTKFEEEMKLLREWDYTTITLDMLITAIKQGADLPPRPLLITFDDGHLNNYTTAFPIMRKYGFTGVLYIIGNYMDADGYMNAEQIKAMVAAGWEVGSHSMSHRDLTALEPQEQKFEIFDSRKYLEKKLGLPVKTFAYPFGVSDETLIDLVGRAGYTSGMNVGYTHDQGTGNLLWLQRRDIKGTYDLKQFAAFLPWQGDLNFLPPDTPIAVDK